MKWLEKGSTAKMTYVNAGHGVARPCRVWESSCGRFQIQQGWFYDGRYPNGTRRYLVNYTLFDGERKVTERARLSHAKASASFIVAPDPDRAPSRTKRRTATPYPIESPP